jgi:hypothetical protein
MELAGPRRQDPAVTTNLSETIRTGKATVVQMKKFLLDKLFPYEINMKKKDLLAVVQKVLNETEKKVRV